MLKPLVHGLLLLSQAARGQYEFWIDLSGEWRMIDGLDRPKFAAPEFDDSRWETTRKKQLDCVPTDSLKKRFLAPIVPSDKAKKKERAQLNELTNSK